VADADEIEAERTIAGRLTLWKCNEHGVRPSNPVEHTGFIVLEHILDADFIQECADGLPLVTGRDDDLRVSEFRGVLKHGTE
jgi:hypothetical protein